MIAAVTGACGHTGANLVRALLERGCVVRATVRSDTRALEGLDVERVPADVLDLSSLRKAFRRVEVVYHLAARISLVARDLNRMYEVNVNGTKNVLRACRAAGVRRLVHFSSIHALDSRPKRGTITESRPLVEGRGTLPYDWTKAQAEREVLKAVSEGLDAVIVNPTAILGPYDFKVSSLGKLLVSLYHRRIKALVKGGFNWVDARDVVEGAIRAEKNGRRGQRYLLGGTWCTLKELALLVEEITGRRAPRFVSPTWLALACVPFTALASKAFGTEPLYTPGSILTVRNHRYISYGKAEKELGYRARPLRETVRDAVGWLQTAGFLE